VSRLTMSSVVINARDVERVAAFWKTLLGVEERTRVRGFVWLEPQPGTNISLAVQQVEDPTEGRNRLHFDFGSSDATETAKQVVELGGRELEQHEIQGFTWTVFADPEDNEFCVAQEGQEYHA